MYKWTAALTNFVLDLAVDDGNVTVFEAPHVDLSLTNTIDCDWYNYFSAEIKITKFTHAQADGFCENRNNEVYVNGHRIYAT